MTSGGGPARGFYYGGKEMIVFITDFIWAFIVVLSVFAVGYFKGLLKASDETVLSYRTNLNMLRDQLTELRRLIVLMADSLNGRPIPDRERHPDVDEEANSTLSAELNRISERFSNLLSDWPHVTSNRRMDHYLRSRNNYLNRAGDSDSFSRWFGSSAGGASGGTAGSSIGSWATFISRRTTTTTEGENTEQPKEEKREEEPEHQEELEL